MTLCSTCGYPIERRRLRRLHGDQRRRARCSLCVSKARYVRSLDTYRREQAQREAHEERVRAARACAGAD